jgi:hypothetical protein
VPVARWQPPNANPLSTAAITAARSINRDDVVDSVMEFEERRDIMAIPCKDKLTTLQGVDKGGSNLHYIRHLIIYQAPET